jgi:hypothetical protein
MKICVENIPADKAVYLSSINHYYNEEHNINTEDLNFADEIFGYRLL